MNISIDHLMETKLTKQTEWVSRLLINRTDIAEHYLRRFFDRYKPVKGVTKIDRLVDQVILLHEEGYYFYQEWYEVYASTPHADLFERLKNTLSLVPMLDETILQVYLLRLHYTVLMCTPGIRLTRGIVVMCRVKAGVVKDNLPTDTFIYRDATAEYLATTGKYFDQIEFPVSDSISYLKGWKRIDYLKTLPLDPLDCLRRQLSLCQIAVMVTSSFLDTFPTATLEAIIEVSLKPLAHSWQVRFLNDVSKAVQQQLLV